MQVEWVQATVYFQVFLVWMVHLVQLNLNHARPKKMPERKEPP